MLSKIKHNRIYVYKDKTGKWTTFRLHLFGFVPLLKIKNNYVYLFGFLPIAKLRWR